MNSTYGPVETDDLIETEDLDPLLPPSQPEQKSWRHRTTAIVALCIGIVTAVDFGFFLVIIPLTRVYEIIICYNYYVITDPGIIAPDGSIAERLCKVEPVQSELAFVRGYEVFFMSLPSVLLAVPYGMLADKWGRKPVLLLTLFGIILAITFILVVCWFSQLFPLRFVWLGWGFNILGGGAAVAMAIVLTIIADVIEENQRATAFFHVAVGTLLAQTLATLVASAFMENSQPWTAVFLGYGIGVSTCCIAFFLPETLNYKSQPDELSDTLIHNYPLRGRFQRPVLSIAWKKTLETFKVTAQETWVFIKQDWKIFALLVTFFINSISVALASTIVQYISKRYEWTIARVGFLLSVRSGANVILFVVVMPYLTWVLTTKFKFDSQRKDLWLARGSVVFLPTGLIIIGLAPTAAIAGLGMMVLTLGTGYAILVRSLVTSMTEPHHVARLYTAVTVFDTLGSLISGPALAALFQWGMKLGGGWIGMPFFVAGVLTALTAVLLWMVDISKLKPDAEVVM